MSEHGLSGKILRANAALTYRASVSPLGDAFGLSSRGRVALSYTNRAQRGSDCAGAPQCIEDTHVGTADSEIGATASIVNLVANATEYLFYRETRASSFANHMDRA